MYDIEKNIQISLRFFATIGFVFLSMILCHCITPYAYFTPYAIKQFPFWILGLGTGYCLNQFRKYY